MRFLSFLVTGFLTSIVTVDLMNSKSALTALALFPLLPSEPSPNPEIPQSQDLDGASTATDWFAGITGRALTDEYSDWRDRVALYSAVTGTNPGSKQLRRPVYR